MSNVLGTSTLETNFLRKCCGESSLDKNQYFQYVSSLSESDLEHKINRSNGLFSVIEEWGAFRKEYEFVCSLIHSHKFYYNTEYKRQHKNKKGGTKGVSLRSCFKFLKDHPYLNNLKILNELENFVYTKMTILEVRKRHELDKGVSDYHFLNDNQIIDYLLDNHWIADFTAYKVVCEKGTDSIIKGIISSETFSIIESYIQKYNRGYMFHRDYFIIHDNFHEIMKNSLKNKVQEL